MKLILSCLIIFVVIYSDFSAHSSPTFINEDGQLGFDDPDHHQHSATHPKKRSAPSPGTNMDRALGMQKKGGKKKNATKKTSYPWDASKAKEKIRDEPTPFLKSFMVEDEEPFPESFYDDYDFEFPRVMQINGNFEERFRKAMELKVKEEMALDESKTE